MCAAFPATRLARRCANCYELYGLFDFKDFMDSRVNVQELGNHVCSIPRDKPGQEVQTRRTNDRVDGCVLYLCTIVSTFRSWATMCAASPATRPARRCANYSTVWT